jgi:hypothetical protein
MSMVRLVYILRLVAVVIASPFIAIGIVVVTLLHPVEAFQRPLHRPLRVWMGVMDWVRGIPVGYSYWERYQAPAMLDQIVVHHHEDSNW